MRKNRIKKYINGTIHITSDKIQVTDPDYDSDVWWRAELPIEPGDYNYTATIKDCGEWGDCVSKLELIKVGASPVPAVKEVALIGADAGIAGFFENKPDYKDDTWKEICKFLSQGEYEKVYVAKKDNAMKCVGVFCSSGYGGGFYPVNQVFDIDGKPCGYEIEFIK